jgi:hypothetical protein
MHKEKYAKILKRPTLKQAAFPGKREALLLLEFFI